MALLGMQFDEGDEPLKFIRNITASDNFGSGTTFGNLTEEGFYPGSGKTPQGAVPSISWYNCTLVLRHGGIHGSIQVIIAADGIYWRRWVGYPTISWEKWKKATGTELNI